MTRLYFLLAAGVCLAIGAPSGADQHVEVTAKNEAVTNEEVVAVASAGSTAVLDLIGSARTAIAGADYAKATQDLTSAQSKLGELRALNPSASLQDGIRSVQSKLDSQGADAAFADFVPIAEGLTVVDDYQDATADVKIVTDKPRYVGTSRAKQALSKAREHLERKDVEKAKVELQTAYEVAVYTELDLPVASTSVEVSQALEALQDGAREGYDKGYAKVADEQLAAAQASVETVVSVAKSGAFDLDVKPE